MWGRSNRRLTEDNLEILKDTPHELRLSSPTTRLAVANPQTHSTRYPVAGKTQSEACLLHGCANPTTGTTSKSALVIALPPESHPKETQGFPHPQRYCNCSERTILYKAEQDHAPPVKYTINFDTDTRFLASASAPALANNSGSASGKADSKDSGIHTQTSQPKSDPIPTKSATATTASASTSRGGNGHGLGLGNIVGGVVGEVASSGGKVLEGVASGAVYAVDDLTSVAGDALAVATAVVGGAAIFATSLVGDAVGDVTSLAGVATSLVGHEIGDAVTLVGDVVAVGTFLVGDATSLAGAFITAAPSLLRDPIGVVKTIAGDAVSIVEDAGDAAFSLVGDVEGVATSLVRHIVSDVAGVVSDATPIVGDVVHDGTSIVGAITSEVVPILTSVARDVFPPVTRIIGAQPPVLTSIVSTVLGDITREVPSPSPTIILPGNTLSSTTPFSIQTNEPNSVPSNNSPQSPPLTSSPPLPPTFTDAPPAPASSDQPIFQVSISTSAYPRDFQSPSSILASASSATTASVIPTSLVGNNFVKAQSNGDDGSEIGLGLSGNVTGTDSVSYPGVSGGPRGNDGDKPRRRREAARRRHRSSLQHLINDEESVRSASPQNIAEDDASMRESWYTAPSPPSVVEPMAYGDLSGGSTTTSDSENPFWDPSELSSRRSSHSYSHSNSAQTRNDRMVTRIPSFISERSTSTSTSSIAFATPRENSKKESIGPGPWIAALFGIFGASGHYDPKRQSKMSWRSHVKPDLPPLQEKFEDQKDDDLAKNDLLNARWGSPLLTALLNSSPPARQAFATT
ncbi:hypothetical protein IMY05_C4459000400 [Salix suchowensis]|nr:hypothetical protein IMY05_C4459000400 [Salix suchowensis]